MPKISELSAATAVNDTDMIPVTQGSSTVRLSAAQIAAYVRTLAVLNNTALTYTLALTDAGRVIRGSNAAEQSYTIPTNASVAIPVGSVVRVRQVGTGQIALLAASGVTANFPAGAQAKTAKRGAEVVLHKVGTNEWDVLGELAI